MKLTLTISPIDANGGIHDVTDEVVALVPRDGGNQPIMADGYALGAAIITAADRLLKEGFTALDATVLIDNQEDDT